MGQFITDEENYLRDRIHFARIYGQSTVFGNQPKRDYVFLQHEKQSDTQHNFTMRVWKNVGGGGTKVRADGNRYCNMSGHKNGMSDYVWVWSTGRMQLWKNRGKKLISDDDQAGFWDDSTGTIWTPPRDINRKDLHLADWDADGDCDIIYVNPDTGAIDVWLNNFPEKGRWDWTYLASPSPALKCSHKRGVGIHDCK